MNAIQTAAHKAADAETFKRVFERMHAATRRSALVERAARQARLDALAALVHDNAGRFVTAISADFGHRSAHETRLLELFPSLESIRHTRSHFGGWMKPQRKSASIWFRPGRARIIPQPLGVVGIIVPWNYPLFLAVSPLAAALAAGAHKLTIPVSASAAHSLANVRKTREEMIAEVRSIVACRISAPVSVAWRKSA